ncbi:protein DETOXIFICATION 16-like isoform X3 [Papaver somniferum]|uniref:protein DETOXIFICATION 16-like isoform X3 n=1 Tax=Papaver somniferum TaxID=3469 RepID=UPI000E6F80B5|nr:protein DETOXIFICATION 16-like isoform X3 [Papaver somniferum]
MMEKKEETCSLNSPLISPNREENKAEIIIEEVKKQLWLSGPLITVNLLHFCIQLISVMFVGHLGELSLSGASMATSFATVTGFSLLMGMASALDTLCGQSYGAKQYHMLGIHMQRGMFILLLVSIPLAFALANTCRILIFVGQDPEISAQAGVYAGYMIPCLFGYALLQCYVRFLQTQNIVFPMMYSGKCERTWTGFSKEALHDILNFIRLAIPSAIMVCLEVWSFELVVLLSGLLPNPKLETSVLSICLNTGSLVSMISSGLSSAVSTRVSNELGADNPQAARLAVKVALVLAASQGILIGAIMILVRNIWGSAYSTEKEVVDYVALMMPILAVSNFIGGLQVVLSGTARGCGWQKIGAYVNLGSYYLVGIPSAVLLAFVLHAGGKGLWVGMVCALFVQGFSLLIITVRTNWEQEAKRASERVYDAAIPVTIVS